MKKNRIPLTAVAICSALALVVFLFVLLPRGRDTAAGGGRGLAATAAGAEDTADAETIPRDAPPRRESEETEGKAGRPEESHADDVERAPDTPGLPAIESGETPDEADLPGGEVNTDGAYTLTRLIAPSNHLP